MAQADQTVQNATFATVRADINNNLAALFSANSGSIEPRVSTPGHPPAVAYMDWIDTSGADAVWKKRNAANNAWLTVATFTGAGLSLGGFAPGTVMLFVQTAAPTGWTKSTTHDNKALRVVSGTAGSGGSTAFTTVFASRTPTGTVGATTLTTAQMPSHTHGAASHTSSAGLQTNRFAYIQNNATNITLTTNATGGGGSHTHSFTGSAMNFAVQYVDVIIATKN
jgi:hypothetical protein